MTIYKYIYIFLCHLADGWVFMILHWDPNQMANPWSFCWLFCGQSSVAVGGEDTDTLHFAALWGRGLYIEG